MTVVNRMNMTTLCSNCVRCINDSLTLLDSLFSPMMSVLDIPKFACLFCHNFCTALLGSFLRYSTNEMHVNY